CFHVPVWFFQQITRGFLLVILLVLLLLLFFVGIVVHVVEFIWILLLTVPISSSAYTPVAILSVTSGRSLLCVTVSVHLVRLIILSQM
ncbi:GSCOCG00005160001-RA-CDS, partial [Cotesia congregata]